jgi:replicative DNA helicase
VSAVPFYKGVVMPLYTMADLESRYERYSRQSELEAFNLGKWIPSFNRIRKLMPGEVMLIVGDTGAGKTALLQSIALAAAPLPTLLFEIELPAELMFERFVAAKQKMPAREVEEAYAIGDSIGRAALEYHFRNLFICDDANMTVEKLENIIVRSELKIGVRPKVVLLDYVQLVKGEGESRYERASNVAEAIKRIAKSTKTIIVMASQRSRPMKDDKAGVGLHDAKETGALENSSGLVVGAWRDKEDRALLHLKILKCTKGFSGLEIPCNFDGETMQITERSVL